ncbi:GNAT family N-acetyltransferase [Virgibacillus sp. L01]|uniref:GNAT family N-acetyltransferase n=1 Tax=Virgibacillus sp. L01 TaxID=3457429 RepID=UPI003FD1F6EF
MPTILKEATEVELIIANQRNLIDFFQITSIYSSGVYYLKQEEVEGLYSDIPIEVVNRVIRTDLSLEDFEIKYKELANIYHKKGVPMFWEIWPTNRPVNIEAVLRAYGFQYSRSYSAMAIGLDTIKGEAPSSQTLEVRKVENKEQANTLATLFTEIYGVPKVVGDGFLKTVLSKGINQDSQLESYIGYESGKPVCISSVYYTAGVAGIYNVGTLSEFSRRGYGKEITLYSLLEAKKNSYHYGILQSSKQGEKLYQRMGFKEQCRISTYKFEMMQ